MPTVGSRSCCVVTSKSGGTREGAGLRSVLSFQERFASPRPSEMTLPQAVKFALRLLMTAAEFDSATGGVNPAAHHFATIKVLRNSGIEDVSPEEQARHLGV